MVKNPPEGYRSVTPYAVVPDPDSVITFVQGVLGGSVKERIEGPEGRVTHAELIIGDSMLMVGGAGESSPAFPAMLHVYLDDVDGVYRTAIEAGAIPLREPEDMFYGDRSGGSPTHRATSGGSPPTSRTSTPKRWHAVPPSSEPWAPTRRTPTTGRGARPRRRAAD